MKKFLYLTCSIFVALIACLFPSELNASEEGPFNIHTRTRIMMPSDAEKQSGDVQMTKIAVRLGYEKKYGLRDRLFYINIGPDHYIIDDATAVGIPDSVKSRGARVGLDMPIPMVDDERYSFRLELNPTYQNAKDLAFDGASFRLNYSTMFRFKDVDEVEWIVGAKIRPEYDTEVLPVFGLNYRPHEKILINLVSHAPNISYEVSEFTKLLMEFDYTFDEFEITDDTKKGSVIEMQDFAAGVGVEHEFNEHILASAGVGGVFNRYIKYLDGTGKAVLKDGMYFNFKVDASF